MDSQQRRMQAEMQRFMLRRRAVLKGGVAGAAAVGRAGVHAPRQRRPGRPDAVHRLAVPAGDRRRERRHLQQALRRERQLRAGAGRVPRGRRDQADRRPAHRHDVLRRGPPDPLEHRRLDALPRGPAGHRGDQGRDVPDQRPQHVAGGRQPGRPALLHRVQLLRLQREASGRGQARAAGDLGGVPRPVPQAEEGQDRRIPVHQRLGPAMGQPVLEPVLDLVLARRQGLRCRAQARLQPGVPRRPGDAQDHLRRSS